MNGDSVFSFNLKSFSALLFGTLIYYSVAIFGISLFSFEPSNITLLWLPFGIGVILIEKFGLKSLPFIFIGSYFANYPGMINETTPYILHTSIAAFADTLAPLLSFLLIRRYVNTRFDTVKVLLPFTFYGALIPTFISGIILSLNLAIGGYIDYDDLCRFIALLMFADGLGLLLLYPLYDTFNTLSTPTPKEIKTSLLYGILAFILIWLSFYLHYLIFLVLPLLLITAFRIRTHMLMSIMLIIVIEMIIFSAEIGHGLFSIGTQIESILMLITYLVSLVFVIMGTSLHHSELITNINLTNTDNLTKVKNVKAYKERIDELLSLFERYNTPFSMMLFDIDNFKVINDTYGHRAGDAVLIEMSSLIQKNIRLTDTLFRVGGEEFVILCPNTTLYEAIDVAEKVRKVVESDLHTITNQRITISIGVSEVKIADAEDTLYRRVDGLMYRSKQNGKNRVTSTL